MFKVTDRLYTIGPVGVDSPVEASKKFLGWTNRLFAPFKSDKLFRVGWTYIFFNVGELFG